MKITYTPEKNGETRIWKKDRVMFGTFPALDQFSGQIVNVFSTRKGGFSKGIYKSMNLDFWNGDLKENVLFNYRDFTKALGIRYTNLVLGDQQHTDHIHIADEEDRGKGISKDRSSVPIDGFITNTPGVGLCILSADCVPVYLYDPKKQAIGLLHSGWKGTVKEISGKAVRMMQKEYGTSPSDLIACIGPSICRNCYEVSRDLYTSFSEVFPQEEIPEIFIPGKDADHFQLDLWKAVQFTLLRCGILPEKIHVTDICTCHNPDLLFSHRYTGGKRGNMASILMLLPEPAGKPLISRESLSLFRKV